MGPSITFLPHGTIWLLLSPKSARRHEDEKILIEADGVIISSPAVLFLHRNLIIDIDMYIYRLGVHFLSSSSLKLPKSQILCWKSTYSYDLLVYILITEF